MAAIGVNSGEASPVPLLVASDANPSPLVHYGFSTRHGGVSVPPRASLDLAVQADTDPEPVVENWRRVLAALAPGLHLDDLALMSQVHGADVIHVEAGRGPLETVGLADGAWTDVPGVVLAVRTADCVPVVLWGPRGVAVAHAGWRGTVAGVVPATVRALCAGTGCAPADLVSVVGPHIGGEAYEVGREVVDGLMGAGLARSSFLVPHPGQRPHVDLGAAVTAQLQGAGVVALHAIGRCTHSDPDLFSYRRDGPRTGRLAGVVVRRP